MMTSFIFLTLFAIIMRTKKHGVVEHTTFFFSRIIGTLQSSSKQCTKDMLQINAIY